MKRDDTGRSAADIEARAWVHRQNIQRYTALLGRESNRESHAQIQTLIREEQEQLQRLASAMTGAVRKQPD